MTFPEKKFLRSLAAFVCCAHPFVGLAAGNESAVDSRPNVLLIAVDDLRPTIGAYGDSLARTPNIDRLAQRGVVFDRAYCNQAICGPSRNALMTGLRPQTTGIYDLGTNFREATPDAITLPQAFRNAGYQTVRVGKILHTGHGNRDDSASWSMPVPPFATPPVTYALEPGAKGKRPLTERADVSDDTYIDGQIALAGSALLEQFARNKEPFFLALGFIRPHLPFVAPEKYWALFDDTEFPLPEIDHLPLGAPEIASSGTGEFSSYSDWRGMDEMTPELRRQLVQGYYAATAYVDAQIGRVLDTLVETGLDRNTTVVIWGDHGFHLGELGEWCKNTNFETVARIPLVVAGPRVDSAGRATGLVENVDIFPTLCELADIPLPMGIDGRSFASLLREPGQPFRDFVAHTILRPAALNKDTTSTVVGYAIRDEKFRFVEWRAVGEAAPEPAIELYDLSEGGLESKNIAAENPEVVALMKQRLHSLPTLPQRMPSGSAKEK